MLNFVQEVLFLIYYQFSTSTDYNSNINLFVGFFNKFRRHDDEYDFAIKVQVELMETNFYSKALTRASQTSTSIWASALATSSPAEDAADWAAVNACLAALMSKLSSLWASSAKIWTLKYENNHVNPNVNCTKLFDFYLESSLTVMDPDDTKNLLVSPPSS